MRGKIALIVATIFLSAASCRNVDVPAISSLTVGREIATNNQVVEGTTTIPATATNIYLSGLVQNPANNTKVKVSWYKLPNSIISTEEFTGNNSNSGGKYDFNKAISRSYFASHIERTELSWERGEYRADVYLSGHKAGSVFFKVVTDSEADTETNTNLLRSVKFGSSIGEDGYIATSQSSFARTASHIYTQIELANSQSSPQVEVIIRFLGDQKPINTFTTTAGQERTLIFDLPLDRFGKNWSDRLWPAGGYQAEVRINGTSTPAVSFVVK